MGDNSLLSVLVNIQEQTPTKSAIGGVSSGWANVHSGVAAKYSPLKGSEVLAYAGFDWTADSAVYFFTDYGLLPNINRIVFENQNYMVRNVQHFKGKRLEHWKVIVERLPN